MRRVPRIAALSERTLPSLIQTLGLTATRAAPTSATRGPNTSRPMRPATTMLVVPIATTTSRWAVQDPSPTKEAAASTTMRRGG